MSIAGQRSGGVLAALLFLLALVCGNSYAATGAKPMMLVERPDAPQQGASGRYALVVGINDYKDQSLPSYRYCEEDARSIADILKQSGNFPAQNVILLLGKEATGSNILAFLSPFAFPEFSGDERFVFYFAGHGATDGADDFLIPYDGTSDLAIFNFKNLSMSNIRKQLGQKQFAQTVLLIDSDRNALGAESHSGIDDLIRSDGSNSRLDIAYGARRNQVRIEDAELGHGVFSYHLLQGLRGAAADSRGVVSALGLENYVSGTMQEYFKNHPGRVQVPVFSGMGSAIIVPALKFDSQPAATRRETQAATGGHAPAPSPAARSDSPPAATMTPPPVPQPPPQDKPRPAGGGRYALVVGINDYSAAGLPSLLYSENDARDVADALRRACGFSQVSLLVGADATQEHFFDELEKLCDPALYPDAETFVLFFSGHGGELDSVSSGPNSRGRRDSYLVPADGTSKAVLAEERSIALDKVKTILDASRYRRKVLLLDACRNSQRTGSRSGGLVANTIDLAPYDAAQGLKVVNSTSAGQLSWEDNTFRHGVFTQYLLEGLRGAARDANGIVTADELYKYVYQQMVVYSRQSGHQTQLPETGGDSTAFIPLSPL